MGPAGFLERYLPYLLRRADQALSAPFYATLASHGVARSEWRVVAVLRELGPLTVVDLAGAALSPQPTVTHAIRRLEARALVTRRKDPADGRRCVVSLTPAGSRLTELLTAEARRLQAEVLEGVEELAELVERLRRLTRHVDSRAPAAEVAMPPADHHDGRQKRAFS